MFIRSFVNIHEIVAAQKSVVGDELRFRDKLLGFHLFPPEVARKEIAFYKTKQNAFGLPLDNRQPYTKLDWILWTATLAGSEEEFRLLADPVYAFLNSTPDRVPMTDWYNARDARKEGFQARPVVGGVLIKMLADPALRAKWQGRAAAN